MLIYKFRKFIASILVAGIIISSFVIVRNIVAQQAQGDLLNKISPNEYKNESVLVSNGFDYPVGNVNADGWYDAQDFGVNNHLGEDWNINTGGDNDCGLPVYAVSEGTIVYAQNAGTGWQNVIIIRSQLPDGSQIETLYGHLQIMLRTTIGLTVSRREQIGTVGKDYPGSSTSFCHLHLEIRFPNSRNWGSPGPGYSSNTTGWTDPSDFIDSHRNLGNSCANTTSTLRNRDGGPPIHPPGSVLKTASNSTVYLIDSNSQKRPLNQNALNQLYNQSTDPRTNTNFSNWVITVGQDELDLYETGGSILAQESGNGMPFPDGKLIGYNGEISIVTGGGKRRPFTSGQRFTDLGYNFCQVVNISQSEYNSYPVGPPVDAMTTLTASLRLYNISYVGQPITGEFTIKNVGYESITLDKLLIGGRLNSSTITDFPYVLAVPLVPGQSYTYSKIFTPSSVGSYRFYVAYQEPNGHWTTSVPANNGVIRTETVTINNAPQTQVTVAVGTNPAGGSFTVDGTTYTTNRSFTWTSGSTHSIGTTTPQVDGNTRYNFSSWSDGGAITHSVTPSANTTYTANFSTQHYLTMNAGTGGNINPSSGWFNAGATVQIIATPNSGNTFSGWSGSGSGSYNGTNNPATVIMNSPITETANFTTAGCNYSINPPSQSFGSNGGNGTVNVTASSGCNWTANSNANWISITSGNTGNGNGSVTFSVASNSGASRTGTITIAGQTFTLLQSGQLVNGRKAFDFDGDTKSDISLFRPSNGMWHFLNSQTGYREQQFANPGDKIVPADYDGDGKTDIAVYRPSNGVWYLLQSQLGYREQQFGGSDFNPVPADYDGDGKADFAVYRPSTGVWYLLQSTNGYKEQQFGGSSHQPVQADYDGDGKTDIAVYLPSNGMWYILRSQLGYIDFQFGGSSYKPVAADYDGDGRADVAVYLPSNGVWYMSRSQLGYGQQQFGGTNYNPVPADYDGDGKTDIAVYLPSNGVWYLLQSTNGYREQQFGGTGFNPVVSAYLP